MHFDMSTAGAARERRHRATENSTLIGTGRAVWRGVALGRSNYLFMGSDAGGERAAAIYSPVESVKLNGLDPQAYLRDVLDQVADHPINRIDELLPWNMGGQPVEQRLAA
jgi:hypothetical protein